MRSPASSTAITPATAQPELLPASRHHHHQELPEHAHRTQPNHVQTTWPLTTNRAATTKGWLGQNAYIDAAHRVQARVEDAIRTGKDAGLGHFPSFDFQVNAAWLTAAMIASVLLAWL